MSEASAQTGVTVVALQPTLVGGDAAANLRTLRAMVADAASDGPMDVLVMPEVFDGRGGDVIDGDAVARSREFVRSIAVEHGVDVIGGSVSTVDGAGRPTNSCFVVDRTGREIGRYDKRILFSGERRRRTPGTIVGVYALAGVRVGVLICADLWWPELGRELAGRADVVAVPAKSAVPGPAHVEYARSLWLSLAMVRAMENGYVVAVSDWSRGAHRVGALIDDDRAHSAYHTTGATTICDPSHRPDVARIQSTLEGGVAGVLRARVDLAALERFRNYRRSVGLLPDESPQ